MVYRIEHLGVTLNVEVTPTLQALGDQPWRCVVKKEGDLFAEEARFFESDCGLNAALDADEDYCRRHGIPDGTIIINCI